MKRKTGNNREGMLAGLVFLFLAAFVLPSIGFAEEGSTGGNWFSNMASNFGDSFSNMFSQIGGGDAGVKPKVRPHFSSTSGFISNATFTDESVDGAWQARVAPGLGISLPMGDKLYNEVDYTYGFATNQGAKIASSTSTHNLNALSRYEISEDTVFGASNNLQWSETPDRLDQTFLLETATAGITHRISPKLTAGIQDQFQFYDEPSKSVAPHPDQDFWDNGVVASFSYEVTEKLSISPSASWRMREFERVKEKDYDQITPILGVGYRLGPKTSLGAHVGWALRDFDRGGHERDIVYGARATHTLGQKLVWGASYNYALQDTFNSAFVNRADNPDASTLDTFNGDFRVIKEHRVDTTATYNFDERNSVGAFGGLQFTKANDADNVRTGADDNQETLETGARYSYRLTRYLSVDIGYSFGKRFHGDPASNRRDYTFHKVSGGLNVAF